MHNHTILKRCRSYRILLLFSLSYFIDLKKDNKSNILYSQVKITLFHANSFACVDTVVVIARSVEMWQSRKIIKTILIYRIFTGLLRRITA
ncbi:hypothetical protein [Rickettsia rickettsii]|uniref:hypothetical protein n=1 Tax=Rickettsia rickettsii TaxID=783 RepID=UPI003753AC92